MWEKLQVWTRLNLNWTWTYGPVQGSDICLNWTIGPVPGSHKSSKNQTKLDFGNTRTGGKGALEIQPVTQGSGGVSELLNMKNKFIFIILSHYDSFTYFSPLIFLIYPLHAPASCLPFLGIVTSYPGVFQGNLHLYLYLWKPTPTAMGRGFHGYGCG